ncbi:hypothetical protein HanRHA438_Chr09g0411891 [Helianthus annuus]|uniref:Uncharacterized protein n=1 Tax=Helianthus annuus TaxID=4232 RepID=A0A9K3N941_HELAN|nr:hypothetical protein HanXRQr2_Chr09g0400051 [Helianthus annuus]KAJ0526908.1 hypothetical protein HanHA300_Chr09g0328361 [Helianthus annuus]KAJ0535471.1 hypothetical protein HanIR_Chr09g0431011 [Helianthus annuus]KAJ0543304.1 hypothetical protein HanHA89_Chr09g0349271 [Helianthus annuus]KAJ0708361.1 hypothetical protein HanLR1_Chr09g0328611 [Helianthus annuus]
MVVVSRRTAARNKRNSERDGMVGGIPAMVDVGASMMEVVRQNHASDGDGLVQIHVRVRLVQPNFCSFHFWHGSRGTSNLVSVRSVLIAASTRVKTRV